MFRITLLVWMRRVDEEPLGARDMVRVSLQFRRRHGEGNIYESRVRDPLQERGQGWRSEGNVPMPFAELLL